MPYAGTKCQGTEGEIIRAILDSSKWGVERSRPPDKTRPALDRSGTILGHVLLLGWAVNETWTGMYSYKGSDAPIRS